jgi:hypothetical protein
MNFKTIVGIAISLFNSKVIEDPECGSGVGSCPEGECCSQYGYCGTTSEYCENTLGCQSKYGSCYASTAKGKCGYGIGRCPKPYHCCSKSGYCGEGDSYCGEGCQSAYGLCGDEQMEVEEEVEWVTEVVTEYVYVYVEEETDSRECGADKNMKCESGKCCSKYGYCGTTEAYCSLSKGCQSKYGECDVDTSAANVASVDEEDKKECGQFIGSCINGECCNSEGHCGISDEFCEIEKGCQEDYGVCNSQSKNGKCGDDFGRCPKKGHCCSVSGYCGDTDEYCSRKQGCQPEYGLCVFDEEVEEDVYEEETTEEPDNVIATTAEPECGKGIGKCPNGGCCSAEGLCGTTSSFCNVKNGCQKDYGVCSSESEIGRCGEGFGKCPVAEQCCSVEGYCGTTEHYCWPSNGCQELYGKCDPNVVDDFNLE